MCFHLAWICRWSPNVDSLLVNQSRPRFNHPHYCQAVIMRIILPHSSLSRPTSFIKWGGVGSISNRPLITLFFLFLAYCAGHWQLSHHNMLDRNTWPEKLSKWSIWALDNMRCVKYEEEGSERSLEWQARQIVRRAVIWQRCKWKEVSDASERSKLLMEKSKPIYLARTWNTDWRVEADAKWQHLTGSNNWNFYLIQKTIGSHHWESKKRNDDIKIWLNKFKNGHLMGYPAVRIF